MKTKYWILLFCLLLVVSVGLSLWLFWPQPAGFVQISAQGQLLHTLPLQVDTVVTVETDLGTNVITVKDGKVAVTEADCPDKYCVARGFCSGGAQIVCLPNRVVLTFVGKSGFDGMVG